jgi:ribonuclease BN (tRNA processing enzyme)
VCSFRSPTADRVCGCGLLTSLVLCGSGVQTSFALFSSLLLVALSSPLLQHATMDHCNQLWEGIVSSSPLTLPSDEQLFVCPPTAEALEQRIRVLPVDASSRCALCLCELSDAGKRATGVNSLSYHRACLNLHRKACVHSSTALS